MLCALVALLSSAAMVERGALGLKYPASWPEPSYIGAAPTPAGVELGRRLFYDPVLSRDSIVSCSSCHLSYTAFAHVDHALSHGIRDSIGTRNAPALMNLAWNKAFMWDGAVNHLDVQALSPINHPAEMGEETTHVVEKLQRIPAYRARFKEVFGDSVITGQRLLKALAQFQLTLISCGSKYDRVKEGSETFTEQEAKGYALFRSNCNACHREPLFTTGEFANNGLPLDSALKDIGRMGVTKAPEDSLRFKIPTLRNIEFSFPYMHDGRSKDLRAVLEHYDHGIVTSRTLAPELAEGILLTPNERTDLIAFLLTLSDREFCFNPDHAFPRQ
ncbi:MAG: cytochrome c peroxidase [Flavobacteriales bacterium]